MKYKLMLTSDKKGDLEELAKILTNTNFFSGLDFHVCGTKTQMEKLINRDPLDFESVSQLVKDMNTLGWRPTK